MAEGSLSRASRQHRFILGLPYLEDEGREKSAHVFSMVTVEIHVEPLRNNLLRLDSSSIDQ